MVVFFLFQGAFWAVSLVCYTPKRVCCLTKVDIYRRSGWETPMMLKTVGYDGERDNLFHSCMRAVFGLALLKQ